MQNRYTGDVGDFGTYGLLRALAAPAGARPMRLGVVWHLVPDESHNADGKHVGYLNSDTALASARATRPSTTPSAPWSNPGDAP